MSCSEDSVWSAEVARIVLAHYARLPESGKPALAKGEFSVLAAIVAVESGDKSSKIVLSLATGTKCCGSGLYQQGDRDGTIICDSHAEVLARRGLVRYLSKSLLGLLAPECDDYFREHCLLESCLDKTNNNHSTKHTSEETTLQQLPEFMPQVAFRLKSNWSLYMYISDNPCGDAAIYGRVSIPQTAQVLSSNNATNNSETKYKVTFTGAKLTTSDVGSDSVGTKRKRIAGETPSREEQEQEMGAVRTKSGRGDIGGVYLSDSMSCSDKLCRWTQLGLQGALLAPWVQPVRLIGVAVDSDPAALPGAQAQGLYRALIGRCQGLREERTELQLAVVPGVGFSRGKCACEQLLRTTGEVPGKLQPCGVSMNWIRDVVRCAAHAEIARTNHRCADFVEIPAQKSKALPPLTDEATPKRPRSARLIWTQGGTLEITLAQAGALLGTAKKAMGSRDTASRLCRRDAALLIADLNRNRLPDATSVSNSYSILKSMSADYRLRRNSFLSTPPFDAWLADEDAERSAFVVP